jgi:diacylglycerol O-acyltransferase
MDDRVGTRLRGWEAATFRTASNDPTMRSTVIAMGILDRAPDWVRMRSRFERLTRFVPSLRMRPIYGLTGLSAPRLAIDPDFDLDVHLRRYRLPEGAGWPDLLVDARRMSLTDFDLDRPLWEAALVEGLPDGQAAFLLKLHHSIADGQATVMIALSLFELGPDPNPDEPEPPAVPDGGDVSIGDIAVANVMDSLREVAGQVNTAVRSAAGLARTAVSDPVDAWAQAWRTLGSITRLTSVAERPLSPVMCGRGTTYRFGAFDLPFADLRAAAKAHACSVNDAFMAALGAGFDAYHLRHHAMVEQLRVNVPISLRGDPGDRTGNASNAVSIARFPFPIAGLTKVERMQAAHELVARWREEPALRLADPLAEVSWFVPVPMLAAQARTSDITASNVPGPPIPLYLAGAKVIAAYPLVATIGAAVNVTMVTYDGRAFIGVSSDDRAVPDHADLLEDLRSGFAEIIGSAVGSADPYDTGAG